MKINFRVLVSAFGALGLALSLAPSSAAQCAVNVHLPLTHSSWHSRPGGVQFLPAAFATVDEQNDRDHDHATIVGFWHQKLVAKESPGLKDGTVLDDGLTQWHSDGTEILNSIRPSISANFCLGVWEKVGPYTYKLNHFPLPFDSTGINFVGPVNIRAEVTLARGGNEYSGTFTYEQYDPTGKMVVSSAKGVVTGTRITVNSTPPNIF